MVAGKADNVVSEGWHYSFNLPDVGEGASGQATLSNGLVHKLTMELPGGPAGQTPAMHLTFSRFNAHISVEPPARAHIVPQQFPPQCPSPSASAIPGA